MLPSPGLYDFAASELPKISLCHATLLCALPAITLSWTQVGDYGGKYVTLAGVCHGVQESSHDRSTNSAVTVIVCMFCFVKTVSVQCLQYVLFFCMLICSAVVFLRVHVNLNACL